VAILPGTGFPACHRINECKGLVNWLDCFRALCAILGRVNPATYPLRAYFLPWNGVNMGGKGRKWGGISGNKGGYFRIICNNPQRPYLSAFAGILKGNGQHLSLLIWNLKRKEKTVWQRI